MPTLQHGARLGPYEITSSLGAGGMGEVYRARDTRLRRDVAIKCLSPELSADHASRQRIEREARSIAALSHPHICTLYDVGTHDDSTYLVMELIDGETLASRLSRTRGGMPIDEALTIAAQVADALGYAHQRHIIHRDLKPANIMLTASGAKLLDFGLAKPGGPGHASDDTRTEWVVTKPHETLGTLAYMSPEQLDGRADERSDIFALGVVVFEMLTGARAFRGDTSSAVIGAIMSTEPPPVSSLRTGVRVMLDRAVRRCLAKDPAKRWQSAADLAEELRWLSTETGVPIAAPAPPRRAALVVVTALAVALIGALLGWPWRASSHTPLSQLAIVFPPGLSLQTFGGGIAVSPNGRTIAFTATDGTEGGSTGSLFVKRMDAVEARIVPGSEGAVYPFFSPDGDSLGFFSRGTLKTWSVSSGAVSKVVDLPPRFSGGPSTWDADGTIFIGVTGARPLAGVIRLSATSGTHEVLTTPDHGQREHSHLSPQQLPKGPLLFTVRSVTESGVAFRLDARDTAGAIHTIIQGASLARYLGNDQLLYQIDETLMLAKFDPRSLTVSDARRVTDGVAASNTGGAWAVGGDTLAYRGVTPPRRRLVWVNRDGTTEPLAMPVRDYTNPTLSPTGERVAVGILDGPRQNLWIADLGRHTLTPLTTDGITGGGGVWTADGAELLSHRMIGGGRSVAAIRTDGSGVSREILSSSDDQTWPASLAADERTLVVMKWGSTSGDLWIMDRDDPDSFRPLVRTPASEFGGRISPNGKWLAYFSDSSGRHELYVTPFPGGGPRWQISRDGAREAVWSRNGGELFYRRGNEMLSVTVHDKHEFIWDPPRVLFSGAFLQLGGPGNVHFDIAPDGRFLMIEEAPLGPPTINVVQGWRQLAR